MITDTNGWALSCPRCGSSHIKKKGFRKLESGEKKQRYGCKDCLWSGSSVQYADAEAVEKSINLAKKAQKYQDINRVERKVFRESARVLNLHEALNDKLIQALEAHKVTPIKRLKAGKVSGAIGIQHYSDLHFNELINVAFNQYDFNIASRRIQKYVDLSIKEFKAKGVERAVVLLGGDLLNSDRRIDEITAACTNRTQAMVLAAQILKQAIAETARHWNVDVFWVCGNEGRVNKELGFNDFVASDNYDHAIPLMMREMFSDVDSVTFHLPESAMECLINVNGQNIVLLHGHGGGGGAPDKKAAGIRAKYAERGITVDYVLWGHIHEAYISELFARSGSPAGGNAFSDKALGLGGKASLNCYVVSEKGEISGTVIPLQNTDDYVGYPFDETLVSYNSKSEAKTMRQTVTFQVVV